MAARRAERWRLGGGRIKNSVEVSMSLPRRNEPPKGYTRGDPRQALARFAIEARISMLGAE